MASPLEVPTWQEELAALVARRKCIVELQAELNATAAAARALLAQASTFPRPRHVVERELADAEQFDLPMLADELAAIDREMARLERLHAGESPPPARAVATTPADSSPLGEARARLLELVAERRAAADRVADRRQEFQAAVATMGDSGEARQRLRAAIDDLAGLDRQIDQLGADVKRLQRAEALEAAAETRDG